ncbi:ATP-grasp domain-containing protein [bacterium]|nr:ATP-grasp domain-containing protein [bacterium]
MRKRGMRVLVANRGEIALRIAAAAEKVGVTPVMLASEADRDAVHATSHEREVLFLSGSAAAESYLNIEAVLQVARDAACTAVHPGYGFLSENAEFAAAVEDAGMVFIGPSAEVIRTMGDKVAAKALAAEAGVPLAPSVEIDDPEKALPLVKQEVGYPLLLKAKAGGGGRGMRLVRDEQNFVSECERAQAEGLRFFGNAAVFAEAYIEAPRHVEVQVFGDGKGKAYHFGTRDCSTQRRHQKLVEEAPAPFLSPKVRSTLEESAVALAEKVSYGGAGTVEFLVKGDSIAFLEMNTRIQVEHPVTEEVYGIDLVEWQFRLALGESLPEEDFVRTPKGHSIEFRIYAEDPAKNFSPALGTITELSLPSHPALRLESGIRSGSVVTPYYDALLMKLIVTGRDRAEALRFSRLLLKQLEIKGLSTTIPFHLWLTHESSFSEAPLTIDEVDASFGASSLHNVPLYAEVDPEHEQVFPEVLRTESFLLQTDDGQERAVQLIHRADGLFEGRFSSEDRSLARISQTKQGVLRALLQIGSGA